ncbi:MAG: EAL domain-containing protein [Acidimicrobiales bacterium]
MRARVKLPLRGRVVVGAASVSGAAVIGLSVHGLATAPAPGSLALTLAGLVGAMLAASWIWPLMNFVGRQSKALHVDEYSFVVLVLLVPSALLIATFALATLVAQGVRRRPLPKSAFNTGQCLLAAAAGCAVFRFAASRGAVTLSHLQLGGSARPPVYGALAAAVLGSFVYLLVNCVSVGAVLVATGTPWRAAFFDDIDTRLIFSAGCVLFGLTTAVIVAADPWLVAVALAPPFVLRLVLADQFEARRDRARVRGLFDATLFAHRSIGEADVTEAVLSSARTLLRCTSAWLAELPGDLSGGALQARLPLPDKHLWLTVSGRNRGEPFDSGDQALLDALAAVGTGALSNAWLYEEGRYQRERLAAITSSMGEGVCALGRGGEVTFLNPAACHMLGWKPTGEPAVSFHPSRRTEPLRVGLRAPAFLLAPARRALATKSTVTSYDTRFERADGAFVNVAFTASPIVAEGEPSGVVIVFRDISERKEFEEQLARHAFHDSLTGLPNRRLFLDHLDHALSRSTRSSETHAVLFIDVDRFKIINDSLGHHAGDHLLVAIAHRMKASLRPGDVLARFGGDEFTVLLEAVHGPEDAVGAAQRILDQLRSPVTLPDGHEVVATASIGIALTLPGMTRDDLLHDADVAMYEIKSKGRGGQYGVFDPTAMGVRSAERIELETSLRRALDEHELTVHFQPVFSIDEGEIVGAEALVRWRHPERGLLPPGSFISLAEETGLILPLGRQVLEEACRQARRWLETFGMALVVSVNLSARQFQQAALVEQIRDVLTGTGVRPEQLCLEVTESLAMDDVDRTRDILLALKDLGVRVAIDDFGTGHSALGYLSSFPVDVVKVDRSFVEGVECDPVKSAIVSAVIRLSEAIGSVTVVEGVETRAQLEHLRVLGCREVQGFHLARPMPASDMDELLRGAVQMMPVALGRRALAHR